MPASREADARNKALLWIAGLIAAAALWVFGAGASVHSFAFLIFGVVLLVAYGAVARWWRIRRAPPLDLTDPVAVERAIAAHHAHQEAIARHTARMTSRRPYATWALLAMIVVVSALEVPAGESWVDRAALVKPLVREGQWWRLLSSTYLHAGLLHIWMNGLSLRNVGIVMEAYAPRARLPLVYLLSALGASLASVVFVPEGTSVGASGAILGLLGYLIVLARRRPDEIFPGMRSALVTAALLTAYLGLFGFAFIDNAAHAGGFATGALVGLATIPRADDPPPSPILDMLGIASWVVLGAGAVFTGLVLLRGQ
jgi:membrane associated rhomboid family serine protease